LCAIPAFASTERPMRADLPSDAAPRRGSVPVDAVRRVVLRGDGRQSSSFKTGSIVFSDRDRPPAAKSASDAASRRQACPPRTTPARRSPTSCSARRSSRSAS
jgi:hypothetical protein